MFLGTISLMDQYHLQSGLEEPIFNYSAEDLPSDSAATFDTAEGLELLELSTSLTEANVSWWSSWGTSLALHVAICASCWALGEVFLTQITVSGSQVVLCAQFSESMPSPLMEMTEVELELTVEDLSDPAEPVSDPIPIPEIVVELPAELVCPPTVVAEKPHMQEVETSSTPSEAAQESTPTEVGLDPLRPAEPIHNVNPDYPREAVARGWHGCVLLRLHICEEGKVSKVDVVESSGHQVLDQAAIDSVQKWRFHPALRGNDPVESIEVLPINFLPRS